MPKRPCRLIWVGPELCESERPSWQLVSEQSRSERMSPKLLKRTERFCSPQDQIQWGILFLNRHLSAAVFF